MLEISVKSLRSSEVNAIESYSIPATFRILGIFWLHYMLLMPYSNDTEEEKSFFSEAKAFYENEIMKDTGVMTPKGAWAII